MSVVHQYRVINLLKSELNVRTYFVLSTSRIITPDFLSVSKPAFLNYQGSKQ